MRTLVDTNVVLRIADEGHPMHGEALAAIDRLDANGHECVIVPQVLYEYWVVATRPGENNGSGMTTGKSSQVKSPSKPPDSRRIVRQIDFCFAGFANYSNGNDHFASRSRPMSAIVGRPDRDMLRSSSLRRSSRTRVTPDCPSTARPHK